MNVTDERHRDYISWTLNRRYRVLDGHAFGALGTWGYRMFFGPRAAAKAARDLRRADQ